MECWSGVLDEGCKEDKHTCALYVCLSSRLVYTGHGHAKGFPSLLTITNGSVAAPAAAAAAAAAAVAIAAAGLAGAAACQSYGRCH